MLWQRACCADWQRPSCQTTVELFVSWFSLYCYYRKAKAALDTLIKGQYYIEEVRRPRFRCCGPGVLPLPVLVVVTCTWARLLARSACFLVLNELGFSFVRRKSHGRQVN